MHLFHDAKFPTEAIATVIAGVKARDFAGVETVDAAIEVVGCVNAFRDGGHGPFGAAGDTFFVPANEDEAVALAEQAEGETQAFGDHEDDEAPDAISPVILSIVWFVIERWLRRR